MVNNSLAEKLITKNLKRVLFSPFVKAIQEFELLGSGDKVAVCISGGKDSLLLAKLFNELLKHKKYPFEIVYLAMNPGFSNENLQNMEKNAKNLNIDLQIFSSDVFYVSSKLEPNNPCYMCARMRRGFLYSKAKELGCNKIALGHHFDDVIETTVLNLFYGGQFKTMPPKLRSKNFSGITLIRPLYYIRERDILKWQSLINLNAMNCGCIVTEKKLPSKRREIKELINVLSKQIPKLEQSILNATMNANCDRLLGFKFKDKKYLFKDIYGATDDL